MKAGSYYGIIESTNYLASPSDRLNQLGKKERAAQFGLADFAHDESFEGNQSFPKALHPQSKYKQNEILTGGDITHARGCELNSVNFLKQNLLKNHNSSLSSKAAARRHLLNDTTINRSGHNNNASCLSTTHNNIDKSWMFYNQFMTSNANIGGDTSQEHLLTVSNPNKALVVINGRTTEILTANDISCDLFGLTDAELIGTKLKDLLDLSECASNGERKEVLMETDKLDQHGRVVLCSGKIFEAYTVDPLVGGKCGEQQAKAGGNEGKLKIPVSIYMLKLTNEQEPRCLCVMEPIQRILGTFAINFKGRLCFYNPNFSYIFGYTNATNQAPSSLASLSTTSILNGKDINDLIPSMKLPINGILPEVKKQQLTGRSFQGENIPLTVNIVSKQIHNEEIVFNCSVSVYTNISGLFTVRPTDYQINSYNPTFSRLIFGYNDKELLNKPITYLIPNFFDPDTSSTVTNKMTPFNNHNNNNSYHNTTSNKRQNINDSNQRRSVNTHLPMVNVNGSFLEANNKSTHNAKTPSKKPATETQKPTVVSTENDIKVNDENANAKVPSFLITDADNKSNSTLDNDDCTEIAKKLAEKSCKSCHKKFTSQLKAVGS